MVRGKLVVLEKMHRKITGSIRLDMPVWVIMITKRIAIIKILSINSRIAINLDLVYLDPPYNQHPYGSNYFMLNVIANNQTTKISKVSGIPAIGIGRRIIV